MEKKHEKDLKFKKKKFRFLKKEIGSDTEIVFPIPKPGFGRTLGLQVCSHLHL